jgi:tetratricopeptide (TPR) repeat protein
MHTSQKIMRVCLVVALLGIAQGVAARESPDQLPMYGGLDRAADPHLRKIDEDFIARVSREFGSRGKASELWVDEGVRFYLHDNYKKAMQRFNQAWLLNPNNPGAFWGFAMVYHDKGQACEALKMIERAETLGLSKPIALADAGRITTLCGVEDTSMSQQAREELNARSEALYQRADQAAPNNDYILGSWATAYYWRGDYAAAWKKVSEARAAGGTLPGQFINMLRAKMPEPKE